MTLRQDHLLAHMDAYAVEKSTNILLLKYMGISSGASKIVKSKLLAIDPSTKTLLVKFDEGLLPQGDTGQTGNVGIQGDTGDQGDTGIGGRDITDYTLAWLGL